MNIGIVGLGLIGASFAKSFQRDGKLNVWGTDIIEKNVTDALAHGEIQAELTADRLPQCDIIITALYPEDTVRYIHGHASLFGADTIVMDCCGIKESICSALKPIARKHNFTFIGADPFAGKNSSGYNSSAAALFDNAVIILTPYEDTPQEKLDKLCGLLMRAGFSSVMKMAPSEHDRIIALTSQLTHIVSNALIKSPTASQGNSLFSGSFRDLTKHASLNDQMWSEVFVGNKKYLTQEIDTFIRHLQEYRNSIETGNVTDLQEITKEDSEKKAEVIQNNVITVAASRSYQVIVNQGLIENTGKYIRQIASPSTVVVVADDSVFTLYGQTVMDSIVKEGIRVLRFVFPHGEQSKCRDTLFQLLEYMANEAVTRSDLIVALGGGVTGDLTGFAASIYLRGTPFIQIPTSLLAAVDSSVGGKTAIDLIAGKNLAGTFNQPRLVLCDTRTLDTLPAEEFSSGMGEVIKYGVLCDPELFRLVEAYDAHDHLDWIIRRCVTIKREVVMADEFDTGSRQVLNLGHTLAHAIEKLSNYSINHGHAVAIGLVAIARCAYATGLADEDSADRIAAVLTKYNLPTACDFPVDQLCEVILKDKKRSGQTINLVIPRKIGDTYLYKMDVDQLESFYSHM